MRPDRKGQCSRLSSSFTRLQIRAVWVRSANSRCLTNFLCISTSGRRRHAANTFRTTQGDRSLERSLGRVDVVGPLWRTYYLSAQYGPRATSAVKGVFDSFCFFWRCFADVKISQILYVCEENGYLPGELTLHRVMRSAGVHG